MNVRFTFLVRTFISEKGVRLKLISIILDNILSRWWKLDLNEVMYTCCNADLLIFDVWKNWKAQRKGHCKIILSTWHNIYINDDNDESYMIQKSVSEMCNLNAINNFNILFKNLFINRGYWIYSQHGMMIFNILFRRDEKVILICLFDVFRNTLR